MKKSLLFIIGALCMLCIHTFAQSNEDISGGLVWESEPYMVIDPANPQHIVVAWMGTSSHLNIKVITTFNGGSTWNTPVVIPHVSPNYTCADVSMAFDRSGNLYTCYIDSKITHDSGAVYITKSTDGGLSFGTPTMVISGFADGSKYPLDRPWLAVARGTGISPDTLCVTTKPAPWVLPPNRPYFVKSYDNGTTWSAWRYMDSTGYLVGNLIQAPMAAPTVDSAGRFHCMYPTYLPSESIYPRYIMATEGAGSSFSYKTAYTIMSSGGALDTLAKAGGRFICDPSQNNHLAFVYVANQLGDLDIFCLETMDGGNTWATPVRINDDAASNGKMQDMTWAGFDENGNLVTAWRDRRSAAGTGYQQPTEIWGAIKWKDSANFSANFRISDTATPYDSIYLSGSGNDFMNVAMAQDTLSAVWGDVRTGALNIWFSRRSMHTGTTTLFKKIVSENTPSINVYPNPGSTQINLEGSELTGVIFFDLAGKTILQQQIHGNKANIDVSHLVPGTYTAIINTRNGSVGKKVKIVR